MWSRVLAFSCMATLAATEGVDDNRLGNLDEGDVKAQLDLEMSATQQNLASAHPDERLKKIRATLEKMYVALPKNAEGKLGRQVVRYALHRYFVRQFGWFIRGLEPTRGQEHADLNHHNSSELREWVPSYLQDVFELQQHQEGADLNGLVVLAASLEDIIHLEARERFKGAMTMHKLEPDDKLNRTQAEAVVTTYYVEFLRNNDLEFRRLAGEEPTNEDKAPTQEWLSTYETEKWNVEWPWIQGMLDREQMEQYTIDALQRVANGIGEGYHTINDRTCKGLKATLQGMVGKRAGRVPLSAFWDSKDSSWKFSESKEYLKSLGLLDEGDAQNAKPTVIVTNYLTSRHNCFAPSDVYAICCRSECEDLMDSIEQQTGSATATTGQIADIVTKLSTSSVTPRPVLPQGLLTRLSEIAEIHDGVVPLHGRLFAQWMHHAFPMECIFPHEQGAINPQTPAEWLNETGLALHATEEEILKHLGDEACPLSGCPEEINTELPWSTNEELLIWNQEVGTSARKTRWQQRLGRRLLVALCLTAALACAWYFGDRQAIEQPHMIGGLLFALAYIVGVLNEGLMLCMLVFGCIAWGCRRVLPVPQKSQKDSLLDKLV